MKKYLIDFGLGVTLSLFVYFGASIFGGPVGESPLLTGISPVIDLLLHVLAIGIVFSLLFRATKNKFPRKVSKAIIWLIGGLLMGAVINWVILYVLWQ